MPRPFLQVLRGDQVPLARGLRGLALVLFALLLVGPGFGGGASGPWNTSFAGGPSAARVGASPGGEAAQTGRLLWQNVTFPPGHLPPARCCGAMAYDAFTQEMVEFGGIGVCGGCNDTYVLSAGRWLDLPASQNTAPPSRSWSSMAYDPALQEIVLFGGESYAGQPLGDTWTFNGTVWSQLAPAQAPAPRWSAGLAWDGQDGALRDISLVNAAAAIVVAGLAEDLASGIALARESVDAGSARRVLDRLIEVSQRLRSEDIQQANVSR